MKSMTEKQLLDLIQRYRLNECSDDEVALLESWYLKREASPEGMLTSEDFATDLLLIQSTLTSQDLLSKPEKLSLTRWWPQVGIAASFLVLLSIIFFQFVVKNDQKKLLNVYKNDIKAGSMRASIRLANGISIPLSGAHTAVSITNKGIRYEDGANVAAASSNLDQVNEKLVLETPVGGTYHFILPDGTKVWLNSSSVLTFVKSFSGKVKRSVELTGEAYFEVYPNENQPFVVTSRDQELTVIGTHFNINAYEDEPAILTTLAEGRVLVKQIRRNDPSVSLYPGEQSVLDNNGLNKKAVEVARFLSWKDGYFSFENIEIEEIMRAVSRWYNVEVVYRGSSSDRRYTGFISKDVNISELLNILERTKSVKFKVEGRRVTVIK